MSKYTTEQLREIFQHPFNQEAWKAIVRDIFKATSLRSKPELFTLPEDTEQGYYFGAIDTPDNYRVGVFFYKISHGSVAHKKVGLRNLVKKFVNPNWGEFDAALVVFSDGKEWRLSFVCDIKKETTSPKRFTFVFGEHDNFYRTAIERFNILQEGDASFENIRKSFSVQKLSDDFFNDYRELYADFCQYITGKRYVKEGGKWVEKKYKEPNEQYLSTFKKDDKLVRDYIKKMFGRIVFLYFLQRKGWLDGNRQYMHDLFAKSSQKDNFLDGVLEPLFFEVLNTDKQYRTEAARALPGSENIPYLNGGLFAQDEIDALNCVFPENYFKRLFDFLDSYNFTIDENDTDDAEVGIDPEMLGRIFENLLEDNKDKGAFYTPKEIVDYMCRESIIAYLQDDKFSAEGNASIRQFVETLDAEPLNSEQKIYLRRKLQAVKICDPAIGSGAFPMGLVNLLSKLYVAMKADTDTAKMKRHIMEQNIYGVDIEKGAVDIARLRFWLAMIVEEKEPMPLPNLHFKIMQGNSLLESYNGIDLSDLTKFEQKQQQGILDFGDNEDREYLVRNLKRYYNTSNHDERNHLFNEIINNIRRQLFEKNIRLPEGMDPSANDQFFLWHTWFSDVFENGGFDIVIGNPPYIQLQANKGQLGNLYKDCKFETFAKTGDIYSLFYEKGWQILKPKGHLCFITSNKWMRAGYGEKTRKFFAMKANPQLLLDFAGTKIFENATVDTNILLLAKAKNTGSTKACIVNGIDNLSLFVQHNYTETDFSIVGSASWVILSDIEKSIKAKIESVGTPLKEWDIQIYRGVLTGYNKAFIISTDKRNEILSNCQSEDERQRTEELIRPILRGRDIKRYGYDWAGLWLINTHNGIRGKRERIHIEDYPAVKNHLDKYWDIISSRADKGDTPYNLRNCAYMEDFDQPKIIYPNMTKYMPFYFDEKNFFQNDKSFMITGKYISFLCAFLNSSLFKFCFRDSFPELLGGTRELRKVFFDKIPVLQPTPEQEEAFKNLINNIQETYTKDKAVHIDNLIFDLYNLTLEERKIIRYIEIQ